MTKYIIKYITKVNGGEITTYHETFSINTDNTAMNVYVEHITPDKAKARHFFDREEAERMSVAFSNIYSVPSIIKL